MAVAHRSKHHFYDLEVSRYFRNIAARYSHARTEHDERSRWSVFGKTLNELIPAIVVIIAAIAALIFLFETTPE